MENLLEHVKIATRMNKNKLNLDLLKKYTIQMLENTCMNLEQYEVNKEIYSTSNFIQEEIIKDQDSIKYFEKIFNEKLDLNEVSNLVEILQNKNEKITNYPIDNILEVLKDINMQGEISYLYLKYFSQKVKSNIGKNAVIGNIKYFLTDSNNRLEDLNEEERNLFVKPYLSNYNLIPRRNLKEVYELLVQNDELEQLIYFLFKNKLYLPLDIDAYKILNENSKVIKEYLLKINNLIENETLYGLLLRWIENGYSVYDLKIIENRIDKVEKKNLESIVANRSGYINFIFGNRISKMNLENINQDKERLIIYAISNNKKGFLKLIEQKQEDFLQIPSTSVLYDKDVYSKYFNINELNNNNLKELKYMNGKNSYFYLLNENITYTFNEIKTLYNANYKAYYILYNYLLDLKVDERLIRIKQLINKELLNQYYTDEEIKSLGEKLKIKSLYNWIEQDFSHIKDITPTMAVKLLIDYEYISKFINAIENIEELSYILRNKEIVSEYNNFQDMKDNIENIDKSWQKLIEIMELKQEFIEKNKYNIKRFLIKNGAEIALTYYNELTNKEKRESYKLIVKSELMGEFNKLKYFSDDLNKEISFNLSDMQIEEWTKNNIEISNEGIEVSEYDDFYHTMILGLKPIRTCLCYIDGGYNQCLLACFDSNKKILYAKINGKIVGRAMIRLTKGRYNSNKKTSTLSFVDLENVDDKEIKEEDKEEILTIFLEKAYISGVSPEVEGKINKMFIELVEKKAIKMNALLVLSNYYGTIPKKDYIYTKYYMYISKSKAGSQYLDSLSGQATVLDEGQYKSNNFLIWQPKINNEFFLII